VWYVPQYTALSSGSDAFTVPNQWHVLPVLKAAARFMAIQEKDPSDLNARAEAVRARIVASAANRDAGDPGKARDVRGHRGPLNGFSYDRERF
jgi:hypothetical protein